MTTSVARCCCYPIYSGRQTCGCTTGFLHLPSAVLALIFFARRIQPSLSLVDREVEFCVVDSHVQRIVLATKETTVTQQVSHRPIKCQSRLWSQRGTKVNGSHHGDNPLLRPTGILTVTKSYAILQAMAPTIVETVHQTALLHIESSLDRLGLLSPTASVLSNRAENS